MQIVCTSAGICNVDRPGQGIADLKKAGFNAVMLAFNDYVYGLENLGKENRTISSFCPVDAALYPEKTAELMSAMVDGCKNSGIAMPVVYAPKLSSDTKRTDLNGKIEQLAIESIKLAGSVGAEYVIVSPLFAGIDHREAWEVNRAYYLRLAEAACMNSVGILLENQVRDVNGHPVRGICSQAREAAEWVDGLNKAFGRDIFGFCVDVGVCNICGVNMADYITTLAGRIKALIVRECDGRHEQRNLPFTSGTQTDYAGFFRGLRTIDYDGYIIMDFADSAGSASPMIKPDVIRLGHTAAEYIKWQIGMEKGLLRYSSRVLFGAGQMCRNYMTYYGRKYPPLFTCDNNSSLWGSNVLGLEIQNPEALKSLPEDCVIYICNIYYREIEAQLREMGVTNPVEYFNDEYLPAKSF